MKRFLIAAIVLCCMQSGSAQLTADNILKQAGLKMTGGVKIFEKRYLYLYVMIVSLGAALFCLQMFAALNPYVLFVLAGFVSLALLRFSQSKLDVFATFPEIAKIPLATKILGIRPAIHSDANQV